MNPQEPSNQPLNQGGSTSQAQDVNNSVPNPPQPSPTPPAPTAQPDAPKPSRSPLKIVLMVLGAVFSAVILFFIGLFAWGFIQGAQVRAVADPFMDAMQAKDIPKAASYGQGASDSDKRFLESVAATLGTGERKTVGISLKNSKAYMLYTYPAGQNRYARVELEKLDGWKVRSIVTSANELSLLPGDSEQASQNVSPETDSPAPTAGQCLVPSDFDTLYGSINGAARPASIDYTKTTYTSNVHFKSDSLEYDSPHYGSLLNAFGTFAKQNATKQFTITLTGKVATTQQADLDFAKQRASKVKAELMSYGATDAQVVIESPTNIVEYGGDPNNEVNKRVARNVVIAIPPTCGAAPAQSSDR